MTIFASFIIISSENALSPAYKLMTSYFKKRTSSFRNEHTRTRSVNWRTRYVSGVGENALRSALGVYEMRYLWGCSIGFFFGIFI